MRRSDLVSDCDNCSGLCCIAFAFDASEDFAINKPAGVRCPHLGRDCRCDIHGELATRGFAGCVVFDCYGAGSQLTRVLHGVKTADARAQAWFSCLRVVHELLWLVTEAAKLCPPQQVELSAELARETVVLETLAVEPFESLRHVDLAAHELRVRACLRRMGAALGGRRALPVIASGPRVA
ncbi:MAG: hypothetical protein RL701_3582 [Pseudomonadota bacterium]|jgi:hypothetical protein